MAVLVLMSIEFKVKDRQNVLGTVIILALRETGTSNSRVKRDFPVEGKFQHGKDCRELKKRRKSIRWRKSHM